MECEEPAAGLVHPLGNEIGHLAESGGSQFFQAFLGKRHGARVKPDVYQVGFASHGLPVCRGEDPCVHKRPVQVYLFVVLPAEVTGNKTFILQWVGDHKSFGHGIFEGFVQFLQGADAAFFAAVFGAPHGQGRSPETAA